MADPAARNDDPTRCVHGFSLLKVETRGVTINSQNAAKVFDCSGCTGKVIVTGSATVRINSQPAARHKDMTTDGEIILGSDNVRIGGPRIAITGSAASQTQACRSAAHTRKTGKTSQSYGNCGLEAWRNAINHERSAQGLPPVTEDELLKKAIAMGLAGDDPAKPWRLGATSAADRKKILEAYGLETEYLWPSVENIRAAVESGKAVSVSIHPYHFGPYVTDSVFHEVAVTGVEYDATGQISAFIVNDTGAGICGLRLPIADFQRELVPKAAVQVSKGPLWR